MKPVEYRRKSAPIYRTQTLKMLVVGKYEQVSKRRIKKGILTVRAFSGSVRIPYKSAK